MDKHAKEWRSQQGANRGPENYSAFVQQDSSSTIMTCACRGHDLTQVYNYIVTLLYRTWKVIDNWSERNQQETLQIKHEKEAKTYEETCFSSRRTLTSCMAVRGSLEKPQALMREV